MKKLIVGIIVGLICVGLYSVYNTTVEANSEVLNRPVATVTLSTEESFKIELYPEEAPNTVNNFIYLAEHDFYNGTKINRVLPDYLIQGGDPIGNGKGFPGYFIESECKYNGIKNQLKHKRGTVSMARSNDFNTEGSQFFVLLEDDRYLDGKYSAFGKIIEGLEIVEGISQQETDGYNRLVDPITITDITIDTQGIAYNEPEVLSVKEVLAQYE